MQESEKNIEDIIKISKQLFEDQEIRNGINNLLNIIKTLEEKENGTIEANTLGSLINSFLANLLYDKKIIIIK